MSLSIAPEDLPPYDIPAEGIIAVDPVSKTFVWIYEYTFPQDRYQAYVLYPYGDQLSPINREVAHVESYGSNELRMPTSEELALIERQLASDVLLPEWPSAGLELQNSGLVPFLPRERFNEYIDDFL